MNATLDTTPKLEELRNDLTSMIALYMDPLPVGQKYVDLRLAMWNYWQAGRRRATGAAGGKSLPEALDFLVAVAIVCFAAGILVGAFIAHVTMYSQWMDGL